MSTGQMMITILAAFLLSMTILTVTKNSNNTASVVSSSRYDIMAISLGTSIIEDATAPNMAFDETTVSGATKDSTTLTAPTLLGIDTGESRDPATFDDFDDYNCFNNSDANHAPKKDSIAVQGVANTWVRFLTICKVDYVSSNNPDVSSATRTWTKRLRLYVYSKDLSDPLTGKTDTVKLSTVYSYWYLP